MKLHPLKSFSEFVTLNEAKSKQPEIFQKFLSINNPSYRIVANHKYKAADGYPHIRGTFGSSSDETIRTIIKELATFGHIIQPSDIEIIYKDTRGSKSKVYDTYKVTDPLTSEYMYIVNQSKDSSIATLTPKQLVPNEFGVEGKEYNSADSFYNDLISGIESVNANDVVKAVLTELANKVYTISFNAGPIDNPLEVSNSFDISTELMSELAPGDLAIINKNFGEMMSGLYALKNMKGANSLLFPAASNNMLTDFIINGYNFSAKSGKGAAPSIKSLVLGCKDIELPQELEEVYLLCKIIHEVPVKDGPLEVAQHMSMYGMNIQSHEALTNIRGLNYKGNLYNELDKFIKKSFKGLSEDEEYEKFNEIFKDFLVAINKESNGSSFINDKEQFARIINKVDIIVSAVSYAVTNVLNKDKMFLENFSKLCRYLEVTQIYFDLMKSGKVRFVLKHFSDNANFKFKSQYSPKTIGSNKLKFIME